MSADDQHECPRDDCDFSRTSLLAVEFHVFNEHDTTIDEWGER